MLPQFELEKKYEDGKLQVYLLLHLHHSINTISAPLFRVWLGSVALCSTGLCFWCENLDASVSSPNRFQLAFPFSTRFCFPWKVTAWNCADEIVNGSVSRIPICYNVVVDMYEKIIRKFWCRVIFEDWKRKKKCSVLGGFGVGPIQLIFVWGYVLENWWGSIRRKLCC
jgi:hypothetical protein